jgi:hypothetical protein
MKCFKQTKNQSNTDLLEGAALLCGSVITLFSEPGDPVRSSVR